MNTIKIFNLLLVLILTTKLSYGFTIEDLDKTLIRNHIYGDFKQEKYITGFSNPILSSGTFSIINKELLWNTNKPRKSIIKINSDGIFSFSKHKEWVAINAQYDKSLFLDIVNMNFKTISSIFKISISGNEKKWRLTLIPKSKISGKIFKNIIIEGHQFISSIVILEENGDKTSMIFTNISVRG